MESPRHECLRLIAALETLAHEEATCVRVDEFSAVASVQARAADIVKRLCEFGPAIADASMRRRLSEIVELRTATTRSIQQKLEAVQLRLDSIGESYRRAAQVAPAYRRSAPPRRSLSVVG